MITKRESLADLKDGVCVLDFYADWCGPCRMMAPQFEKLSESYPKVNFYKVDVENTVGIAEQFQIRSLPTFVLIDKKQEVERVVGADIAKVKAMLDNHLATKTRA